MYVSHLKPLTQNGLAVPPSNTSDVYDGASQDSDQEVSLTPGAELYTEVVYTDQLSSVYTETLLVETACTCVHNVE